MHLRYLKILFIGIAFFVVLPASGQFRYVKHPEGLFASEDKPAYNGITIEAIPFFFDGFSLAYERHIAKGNWIVIQPTYYTKINYSSSRQNAAQNMQGFSIALSHRYTYFEIDKVGLGLYLQWGAMYYQNKITQVSGNFHDIRKLGIDIALGLRQTIIRPLYFTFYIGYGQRFILKNENKIYMENMFDHGYGGANLSIGLGLGFRF